MEDKTIVSNPNPVLEDETVISNAVPTPTSAAIVPPVIRRQLPPTPTMPTAPMVGGTKNLIVQRAGIATAAGLAVISATAYAILVHNGQAGEEVQNVQGVQEVQQGVQTIAPPAPALPEHFEQFTPPSLPPIVAATPVPAMPKIPATAQPVASAVVHADAPIAATVNDEMPFDQAFAAARTEVGAGGAFVWKGKVFDTYYNEEWNAMSSEQHAQYSGSVHVTIPEEAHAIADTPTPTVEPLSISTPNTASEKIYEEKPLVEDNPIAVVESPKGVAEPIYVTAKGIPQGDNLLIDKPDADANEVGASTFQLPNDGAIAHVIKDMNLPSNMHTEQADNNGDGVTDAILVTDTEGHLHAILVDENQNGIFEQAVLDTNNNQKPDLYIVDANEDGTIDQERVLQDNTSSFYSPFLKNDAVTFDNDPEWESHHANLDNDQLAHQDLSMHHENDMMMNDTPDLDSHTDMTDWTG